ncbi:MAG: NgoFVII family restriction endonuclease [Vallitaleaceae bacterium]|nr:NgoFVII family restriction endonuclease [Vallitaleaceae bacterium]
MIIGDSNKITTFSNLKHRLDFLTENNNWDGIALCSAFLTEEGAKSLIESLSKIANLSDIKITVMVGIKNYFTSPKAIKLILDYIDSLPECDFQLLMPFDSEFHMKCYLFWTDVQTTIIIGSANLTVTGLNSIGEISIEINNPIESDEIFSYVNAYAEESYYWSEVIDDYERTYEQSKPVIRSSQKDPLFHFRLHPTLRRI